MKYLIFLLLAALSGCELRRIDDVELAEIRRACERRGAEFTVIYLEDGTANRTRCIKWGDR